ncbi:MAG: hypothetical protein AAFR35_00335 [Pseudomonadota bacterium]
MIGLSIGIFPRFAGDMAGAPRFSVTLSGLTENASHGVVAEIGSTVTAVAGDFSEDAPGDLVFQWVKGGADIPGATGSSYTPLTSDDLGVIHCRVSGSGYPDQVSGAVTVRWAPPIATGPVPEQSFVESSGSQSVNLAAYISGNDLSFVLGAPITGVTLSSAGLLDIDTMMTGVVSPTPLTISVSNSGGTATMGVVLSINVAAVSVAMTGLTANPNFVDSTAEIGSVLAVSASGSVASYRWFTDFGDVSTSATYVPTLTDDGRTLRCEVLIDGAFYTTDAFVVRAPIPVFATGPSISPLNGMPGTIFALTEGVVSTPGATLSIESFRLDGADRSGELTGLVWDSTGESPGALTLRVSAMSSGVTAPVTADAQSGNLTAGSVEPVTVTVSASAPLVGHGVHFFPGLSSGELSALGFADFEDFWDNADFFWSSDQAGTTFANLPPDYPFANRRDVGYGASWAQTALSSDPFTVTLTVENKVTGAVGQGSVTVSPVDVETHPWTHIGWVSLTGDFSDAAPEDAVHTHFTDLASVRSWLSGPARGAGNRVRLRFRRGETYAHGSNGLTFNTMTDALWDAFGTGADPIHTETASPWDKPRMGYFKAVTGNAMARDQDIRMGFDPVTGQSSSAVGYGVQFDGTTTMGYCTAHNIRTRGCRHSVEGIGSAQTSSWLFVSDCDISDWFNYGQCVTRWINVCTYGGQIRQNPNTLWQNDGKTEPEAPSATGSDVEGADHGPIRYADHYRGCIHSISLASYNQWANPAGNFQECIRWYCESVPGTSYVSADRLHMLTAGIQIGRPNPNNAITSLCKRRVNMVVCEDWQQPDFINCRSSGGIVAENIYLWTRANSRFNPARVVGYDDTSAGDMSNVANAVQTAPVIVRNAMFYSERSTSWTFERDIGSNWPNRDVRRQNVILETPNAASKEPSAGPFVDQGNFKVPAAGSIAIDAASGGLLEMAARDIFGNRRDLSGSGSVVDIGPFEDNPLGSGTGSNALGLQSIPDYWIDATAGDDGNDGMSEASPWASLSMISATLLASGSVVRVRVKAGTYATSGDYVSVQNVGVSGATLEIAFEPGCVVDGASYAGNESAFDPSGDAFTFRVYGNGATIQNVQTTTGNALGGNGSVICEYWNFVIDNCVDGMTLHDSTIGTFYDVTVRNCTKAGIAHVNSATASHYRCHVTEKVGGGTGNAVIADGGAMHFEDCILIPDANGGTLEIDGSTMQRCQLGTESKAVRLVTTTDASTLTKCFINAYVDGNSLLTIDRCYGRFSVRSRNGGDIIVRNSVFSGPASSQSRSVFSNYDPGSSSPFEINNTIFAGSYTFMSLDAANAGYLVAAGAAFRNNFLTSGKVYDADLLAADSGGTSVQGTQTGDPLIGPAASLIMSDYAFGAGSPALGSGTNGGDIGFGSAEVEERQPQVVIS